MAFLACDVVAALVLERLYLALRTRFKIICTRELLELPVAYVHTPDPTVVDCATAHADLLATSTGRPLLESVAPPDEVHAAIAGTPAQVRVQIHVNVHPETHILLEDLFRAEVSNIIFEEFILAPVLHAWDIDDLSVDNVSFKML